MSNINAYFVAGLVAVLIVTSSCANVNASSRSIQRIKAELKLAFGLLQKSENDSDVKHRNFKLCTTPANATNDADCFGKFSCWNSWQCVDYSKVCDGFNDCSDGSDEFGCVITIDPYISDAITLSVAAVVGIVIGCIVFLAFIICCMVMLGRRKTIIPGRVIQTNREPPPYTVGSPSATQGITNPLYHPTP